MAASDQETEDEDLPQQHSENQLILEEKVSVLRECASLIGKRKRAVQEQLQEAVSQEMALVKKIQGMQDRVNTLEMTRQRQRNLRMELRKNLSKSRERLAQSIFESFSVLGSTSNTASINIASNNNSYGNSNNSSNANSYFINNNEYKDDIRAVMEASVREMLLLDSALDNPTKQSSHRLRTMRGTCLDLRIMAVEEDPTNDTEQEQINEKQEPTKTDSSLPSRLSQEDDDDKTESNKFDPNVPLCPFELNGVCSDPYCRFQHLSSTRPTTKIIPPELLPLPQLNLPPLVPEPNQDANGSTATAPSADVNQDGDKLVMLAGGSSAAPLDTGAGSGQTDGRDRTDADCTISLDATTQVSSSQDSAPAIVSQSNSSHTFDNLQLLSSPLRTEDQDDALPPPAPESSTTPLSITGQAIEEVRFAVHAGRLPLPQTWEECANMVADGAFRIRRQLQENHSTNNNIGMIESSESLPMRLAQIGLDIEKQWTVDTTDRQQQHQKDNIFFQSFTVQRVLMSLLSDHKKGEGFIHTTARVPITTPIQELVSAYLPQIVSLAQQQYQFQEEDDVNINENVATYLCQSVLAMLEQVASDFVNSKHGNDSFPSSSFRNDCLDLFNAMSKIIADLIANSMDSSTDSGSNKSQQLILTPVCAAHLSLGCFIRQFDVVQLRIEWLLNMSQGTCNMFLYSELLWSQLIQLQLCLPVSLVPPSEETNNDNNDAPSSSSNDETKQSKSSETSTTHHHRLPNKIIECHERLAKYLFSLGVVVRNIKPTVGLQME